jgi:transcriptional regulator of arginine metabolism
VKTAEGYRQFSAEPSGPELADVIDEYLQDIRVAQNLVVLKTSPGNANTLAVSIDREEMNDVVGTIAGDDTVLVISSDSEAADRFRQQLLQMISGS